MVNISIARKSPYYFYGALFGGFLAFALFIGMVLWRLNFVIAYFMAINVVTFCAYGYDKKLSSSSWVRVPEKLLHALSLTGGSPGALMAQRLFRHKTVKASFQIVYWAIVVIQLAIIFMVVW